jgi:hypothetical protein
MTRFRRRPPRWRLGKQPLPSGPKLDDATQRALAEFNGEVKKCPAGRRSYRVKLKPLPPLADRLCDDGEGE